MEIKDCVKSVYAKDRKAWRTGLQKNHDKEKSVWLIIFKKGAAKNRINYAEAVVNSVPNQLKLYTMN
jgi:hypothetical protein